MRDLADDFTYRIELKLIAQGSCKLLMESIVAHVVNQWNVSNNKPILPATTSSINSNGARIRAAIHSSFL